MILVSVKGMLREAGAVQTTMMLREGSEIGEVQLGVEEQFPSNFVRRCGG